MIAANFVWDAWTGDMGALMAIWFLLLPFILIGAGINWLINKARGK